MPTSPLLCVTLARCQRRSAQGRPLPSSAPDSPRLLRQCLYCCTSKASKLSTCLAALSNAVSPVRLKRHDVYFCTSKASKVRTEDVGNIHVHFRVLQHQVQHTSAYGQHTPAYASIRQHTPAYASIHYKCVRRPARGSVGPLSSPTQQLSSRACTPLSHGTTALRPTLPKAQRFDRAPAARPFRGHVRRRSPE